MSKPIVVVGSINLDFVFRATRFPRPGETLMGTGFDTFPGGKGANQAVAVARLGYPVHLIGKLGKDSFSGQLLDALNNAGVRTQSIGRVDGCSGLAMILSAASGENSIVVHVGANGTLDGADILRNRTLIADAAAVLTQLETPLSTLHALTEVTAASNVPLIVDPAPAQALPPEVLSKITWITPNETESEYYAGTESLGKPDTGWFDTARRFMAMGPANVVLKLGARGAYLATRSGICKHVPAFEVDARDTTAAGDAFNGAFAVALARKLPVEQAAEFAAAAAALCVTRPGAQPSMPTQAEVDNFLSHQRSAERPMAAAAAAAEDSGTR